MAAKTLSQRLTELLAYAEKENADKTQNIDKYSLSELVQLVQFKEYLKNNPVTP